MLELIIIIIIVMVIVKKKKGDALKGQGGKGTMPNTTVTTAKPETNRPYNGTYAAGGTYSTSGSGSQHRPSQRNTRKTAIQEAKEDGNSTTAYLMEKAEAGYYDLILMDIQMPNMDGYKATQTIRKLSDPKKAGITIVAMTANAFEEDKANAFRAGMNRHIAKPIKVDELMSALTELLKEQARAL